MGFHPFKKIYASMKTRRMRMKKFWSWKKDERMRINNWVEWREVQPWFCLSFGADSIGYGREICVGMEKLESDVGMDFRF